jgi:hypothetical protein
MFGGEVRGLLNHPVSIESKCLEERSEVKNPSYVVCGDGVNIKEG